MDHNRNRIDYLDGIRALAILLVVGVHWLAPQVPVFRGGYVGVDIFFVLSGYIITTILWRSRDENGILSQYVRFLQKRLKRLFPALAGMIIGTIALFSLFPGAPIPASALLVPGLIALAQGYSLYSAAELGTESPFAVTWSLSIEWMFYLLWPLAIYYCKVKMQPARKVALWMLIAAAVLYFVSLFYNPHWFYFGPQSRFAEMMVGGALALFIGSSSKNQLPIKNYKYASMAGYASILSILAYFILGPAQWSLLFRFVGMPLVVGCTVYLIWIGWRNPSLGAVRALSWSPLTFVGRISYSLYLWHFIGIHLFTRENMAGLPMPVVAFFGVVLAVVATALSYRFLELPFTSSHSSMLRASPAAPRRRADVQTHKSPIL